MVNPVLFYDGECKFCSRSVQYILKNEKEASFRFAHIQEEGTKEFLEKNTRSQMEDSMYVLENGSFYNYSDASIKIAERLKSPHSLLKYIKIFPKSIRDWGYKTIARYRYKLGDRNETCIYPKEMEGRIFRLKTK